MIWSLTGAAPGTATGENLNVHIDKSMNLCKC